MPGTFEVRSIDESSPSDYEVALSTAFLDALADCTWERLGSGIVFVLLHSRYIQYGDVVTYRSNASIDTVYAYFIRSESNQRAMSFMSSKNSRILSAAPSYP